MWSLLYLCLINGVIDVTSQMEDRMSGYSSGTCGGSFEVTDGTTVLQLGTQEHTDVFNDTHGNTFEYSTKYYRVNENCTFHVFSHNGQPMIITSEYFAIEDDENCIFDNMTIEDGDLRTTYCGYEPLAYITSSHSNFSVAFQSDRSFEERGFMLSIKSHEVNEMNFCNNTIIGKTFVSNMISNSELGTNCFYRIEAEDEEVVQLNLQQIDFGSRQCNEESVIIYEGYSSHGKKLQVICSDTKPQLFPFLSRVFFIEYRNPLNNEREDAFRIKYEFVETNVPTTTPKPTLKSPVGGDYDCSGRYIDLPDGNLTYISPFEEDNKHCIVIVRNTELSDHVVQVKFEYFDTEDSENCTFDFLRISSGERVDSPNLGGPYCGESLDGRVFVTSGNSLRLEFKTDRSYAARGFKAFITFEPIGVCSCDRNRICVKQGYEKLCIAGKNCRKNCQNGGTCVTVKGKDTCYCRGEFQGDDCSASTVEGKSKVHLRFSTAPMDKNLREFSAYYPVCQLDVPDYVEVVYQWTLNGNIIGDFSEKTGFGDLRGVLAIDSFKEELEGQYACIATTELGSAEHTFQLRLVSNCKARIESGPKPQSKIVGQNTILPCDVKPRWAVKEVIWKKDSVIIENNDRFQVQPRSFYLVIKNIKLEDEGLYTCHLEDINGCPSSRKAKLTVLDYKPLNKYCGISTWDEGRAAAKISAGEDARSNEDPWHVHFRNKTKGNAVFCGGTLISQQYVITAAHCINDLDRFISYTVLSFGTTSCRSGGTLRNVESYVIHPEYNKGVQFNNDIALIKLDRPIEYRNNIRPVCLAEEGFIDETFLEKHASKNPIPMSGRVVGCGISGTNKWISTLQYVNLPYVPRDKCAEAYERAFDVTKSMFCAGKLVKHTGDTCRGDSGGGFVMYPKYQSQWVLTGIVSFGIGCDRQGSYGVYTNVGVFYEWIKEITKFNEEQVENFIEEKME